MPRKTNLTALSVIAILVCCTVVLAQKPSQSSTPKPAGTEEPSVGNINGATVSEGGQPLQGVPVFVRDVSSGGVARASTSNAEGNFRVNGLAPGLYFISAFSPGYVTQGADPASPAAYHRIGDTVRLEFTRGGVITGTVTNGAGEPVIGVGVRARMIRTAKGEAPRIGNFAASDRTTDDRGVYRLFGLPTGTYLVSAGGAGGQQSFTLNPYDSDLPTYAPSSTRDNAAEISVRTGDETNADIRYRGEPGHRVSGSVKLAGPSNATITLTPVGGVVPIANAFQIPGNTGFAFSGIGDGEYDIVAQEVKAVTPATPDLLVSEPRRITVKGADVTGLELLTRPLAMISGRIALEPAKVAECAGKRRPLFAETMVTLQRPEKDDNDKLPFLRMLSGLGSPDANGNFVLRNLAAGKYLLDPQFHAKYWYLSSISIASTPKVDAAANWTTLKSGDQLANFTITLAEGAASVRGRVTSAAKTAADKIAADKTAADKTNVLTGFSVYLVPAEPDKTADVLRYFVTSVEADGTFAFNNLPPGRYLSLVQTVDAQTSTVAKLRLPEAGETRTKLRRAAENQKADLELKPCQNLTEHQVLIKE